MAPVTPLTAGKMYIMDWLTDADQDLQDLNGKTEGTNYVVCDIPQYARDASDDGKKISFLANNTNFVLAFGIYQNFFKCTGVINESAIATTATKYGYWKSFQYAKRKTTTLYMTWKFADTIYWPWIDNGTTREYSKGCLATPGIDGGWNEGFYTRINISWMWAQLF